jgi:hypothetical protein
VLGGRGRGRSGRRNFVCFSVEKPCENDLMASIHRSFLSPKHFGRVPPGMAYSTEEKAGQTLKGEDSITVININGKITITTSVRHPRPENDSYRGASCMSTPWGDLLPPGRTSTFSKSFHTLWVCLQYRKWPRGNGPHTV